MGGRIPPPSRGRWRKSEEGIIILFTKGINYLIPSSMSDDVLYSRLQLMRLTGAPEDAIVFWIRYGLIQSVENGTRKHKRFTQAEVKIAALLKVARANGMNVGAMRAIAANLRAAIDFNVQSGFTLTDVLLGRDIAMGTDSRSEIAGYYKPREHAETRAREAERASTVFPFEHTDKFLIGHQVIEAEGVLMLWSDENGDWHSDWRLPQNEPLPASSVMVFDCAKIFAIDWSTAGAP